MKTKLFIASVALASTFSQMSIARDSSRFVVDRAPTLFPVQLIGTLRCEDRETDKDHRSDHKCDLEFVNDETGEVWNIKENPTLTSIHQKGDRETKAHIEGMRSPRYLLGGSFIQVHKIETLPSKIAEVPTKNEAVSKPTHVCSLDSSLGKN